MTYNLNEYKVHYYLSEEWAVVFKTYSTFYKQCPLH